MEALIIDAGRPLGRSGIRMPASLYQLWNKEFYQGLQTLCQRDATILEQL